MPKSHPIDESLARLGVEELEERLEFAPILAGDGVVGAHDCCSNFCSCEVKLPEIVDGKPILG
ncbi:MAG TPA: hypothetical protein P5571_06550 [Candidatus Krumholzibacteria bacterium]|nr:hypothetical protein [Candidatus Krumholzibacteria bacterium]HRX51003.1 hypothetical protein [Candidatus Krumholzibacteria bacterium]